MNNKNTNFIGQPVLKQILSLIDKHVILKKAKKLSADRYTKKFDSYSHFVSMLYCIVSDFSSLRELCIGLMSNSRHLAHLGMSYLPKRSTVSDANKRRDSCLFEEVYLHLLSQYRDVLSDSSKQNSYQDRLYLIDSTTITLFKEILKGAGRNPKQGKKKVA